MIYIYVAAIVVFVVYATIRIFFTVDAHVWTRKIEATLNKLTIELHELKAKVGKDTDANYTPQRVRIKLKDGLSPEQREAALWNLIRSDAEVVVKLQRENYQLKKELEEVLNEQNIISEVSEGTQEA